MFAAAEIPADAGLLAILTLSLGAGLVHALDADHVAAVSALAVRGNRWTRVMRVSGAWAIGHGTMLLLVGAAVYILGFAIPEGLASIAEQSVGVILIAVGAAVLYQLYKSRAHVHTHSHDDLPPHAHLHTQEDGAEHSHSTSTETHADPSAAGHSSDDDSHRHEHRAVLVGSVHGLAGSAPLLALIPLSQVGSSAMGMAYLVAFGVGVFVAMAVFGGLFGGLIGWGSRTSQVLVKGIPAVTGTLSVGLGAWLLLGA